MADELTLHRQNELVKVLEKQELGEVLRPMIREIHLFDTYVAGTTHLEDSSVLEQVREGDRLLLQREDNKFDSSAVLILTREKKKLGYIPEKDDLIFSRLMDAGKLLAAKIGKLQKKGSFLQIGISIYLMDI